MQNNTEWKTIAGFDRYVREESLSISINSKGTYTIFKISHKPLPGKGRVQNKA